MLSAFVTLLVLSATALAQDLNVLTDARGAPIWLLQPIPGHWTERTGFGTPSVVYDEQSRRFVMYFESRIYDEWLFNPPTGTPAGLGLNPRSYDDCRLGRNPANPAIVWAIGRATSVDGFVWSVDPEPVLLPAPGTFYACQVAQPAAVYEKPNHWHLYFKAVQWNPNESDPQRVEPCSTGVAPVWGCTRTTGFGYASSQNGRTWVDRHLVLSAAGIASATGVPDDQIGFPRVSMLSRDWYLWYTAVPRVYQAFASTPAGSFVSGTTPISDYPVTRTGRLTTGTVFCRNFVPPAAMLDGQWGSADPEVCGLSVLATQDLRTWVRQSDEPVLSWDCESGWDRWDVLETGSDLVMWYAARESAASTAPRRIGFASTLPLGPTPPYTSIDKNSTGGKVCKRSPIYAGQLAGWTAELGPVPAPERPETPSSRGGRGLGCGGGPPAGVAALPLLLLATRRRRRS